MEHYRIIYKNNKLTVDEEDYFENLTHLVQVCLKGFELKDQIVLEKVIKIDEMLKIYRLRPCKLNPYAPILWSALRFDYLSFIYVIGTRENESVLSFIGCG